LPNIKDCPFVGWIRPGIILRRVVLPAPLGREQAIDDPLTDVEANVVYGEDVSAEPFAQIND